MAFFPPGDVVLLLLMNGFPEIAVFFEIQRDNLSGVASDVISLVIWIIVWAIICSAFAEP